MGYRNFVKAMRTVYGDYVRTAPGGLIIVGYRPHEMIGHAKESDARMSDADDEQRVVRKKMRETARSLLATYDVAASARVVDARHIVHGSGSSGPAAAGRARISEPAPLYTMAQMLEENRSHVEPVGHVGRYVFDPSDPSHLIVAEPFIQDGAIVTIHGIAPTGDLEKAEKVLRYAAGMLGELYVPDSELIFPHGVERPGREMPKPPQAEKPSGGYTRMLEVKGNDGLHLRPTMKLVEVFDRYPGTVTVRYGDKTVDGKSMLEMSVLAATKGAHAEVSLGGAGGADPDALYRAIRPVFDGVSE